MAQQILSTNTFTTAKWIVSSAASDGTHTTLAGAMASASSGDTIFLRTSVTENVTLTPGVNITAWSGGSLNTPSITGTLTMTGAGTSTISGIELITNSAAFLAVTGSAASILNINNCYLNCSNNTGITFSSSNASAAIVICNCRGDTGTTGIAYFSHSSAGFLSILNSQLENHGNSTTASTISSGNLFIENSRVVNSITSSSTGVIQINNSQIVSPSGAANQTMITHGGSATNCFITNSQVASGTSSAISISSTFGVYNCVVDSSNANAITGAGTLNYSGIFFSGSSSTINTSTTSPAALTVPQGGTGLTAPGTSGNVLTSNGTIWTSSAPAASGPSGQTYLKISLTSAQIKALHGTPVQVIAAPGAGKAIVPISCWGKLVYGGSNVFVAGASQSIQLTYGSGTSVPMVQSAVTNGTIVASASTYSTYGSLNLSAIQAATAIENVAIYAYVSSATEITGNAANDNTISIALMYYVVTL